jgi:hypothetical protein
MREIDPYELKQFKASRGISNDIFKKVLDYLAIAPEDTSFGYKSKKLDYVFITGCNKYEQDIPVFDIPIIRDGRCIVDLRKFAKKDVEYNKDLDKLMLAHGAHKPIVDTVVRLGKSLEEGNVSDKDVYFKLLGFSLGRLITNALSLNARDSYIVQICILNLIISNIEEGIDKARLVYMIHKSFISGFGRADMELIEEVIDTTGVITDLDGLIKAFGLFGNRRLSKMGYIGFVTIISQLVPSNFKNHVLIGISIPEFFISIIPVFRDQSIYKKTKLAIFIATTKKFIDTSTIK